MPPYGSGRLPAAEGGAAIARPDWDEYFLDMARLAATRSTCCRRRVGAVLSRDQRVVATGYNGSLRGQPHCTDVGCLMVDGHCKRTVHAELNALLQCAFHGASSQGTVLYTTSFPCLDCAKALIQAGVVRVVYRDAYTDEHSRRMLREAGIVLDRVPAEAPPAADAGHAGGPGPAPRASGRALGGLQPRCGEAAFVAASAEVDGDVELGRGASVWYGAVLRGDIAPIRIGDGSNIQDGCVVHTDAGMACVVGRRVTVGHRAVLHGCTVGDGALIGMGATILSGATIGRGAVIGAGALVTEGQNVPEGTVALGVPARAVRPVRPAEAERAAAGAEHYMALAAIHREAAAP